MPRICRLLKKETEERVRRGLALVVANGGIPMRAAPLKFDMTQLTHNFHSPLTTYKYTLHIQHKCDISSTDDHDSLTSVLCIT